MTRRQRLGGSGALTCGHVDGRRVGDLTCSGLGAGSWRHRDVAPVPLVHEAQIGEPQPQAPPPLRPAPGDRRSKLVEGSIAGGEPARLLLDEAETLLCVLGALCHDRGIIFHTDATQWVGKMPTDVERDNIDLLSWSGHKIFGPKGVGALYVRDGKPRFAVRHDRQLHEIVADRPLPGGASTVEARYASDGTMTLSIDGRSAATGQAPPFDAMPGEGLTVGSDPRGAVGDYEAPFSFDGRIGSIKLTLEK